MQRPMRHNERVASCLAHLMGIVPLWGALYMAITYWRFRGRSRRVTFHAAQALLFHLAMLAVATLPLIAVLAGSMISVLRPTLGEMVIEISVYLLLMVYAVNTITALMAAANVIDEREFDYPLLGRRLRPQYQDPPSVPARTRFPTFTTPQPPDDEFILNAEDNNDAPTEKKFEADSFADEADLTDDEETSDEADELETEAAEESDDTAFDDSKIEPENLEEDLSEDESEKAGDSSSNEEKTNEAEDAKNGEESSDADPEDAVEEPAKADSTPRSSRKNSGKSSSRSRRKKRS